MADKKLLEESTIRRFMELANIKPTEKGMLSESKLPKSGRPHHAGMRNGEEDAPLGEIGVRGAVAEKKEQKRSMHQEDLEETVDEDLEEGMDEAGQYEEASLEEADDEGMGDEGGDEAPEAAGAGMEGGDIKAAFQKAIDAFNELASSIPELQGSEVAMEPEEGSDEMGGEEEASSPDDQMSMDEAPVMERKKKKMEEEELEESIELVDDTLVEKLLQRVSARLVAEARKSRELAESKKGWTKVPSKSASEKAKTKGKGPKPTAPFNKSVGGVPGLAGRGRGR